MAIDFPRSKYTAAQGASDNTPAWPNPPSSGDTRTNSAGHTFNWNVGQSMWILATDTSHTITNGPTYSWDGEKWIAQSAIPFRYHGALASDPTGLSASDEGDLYFNSTNDDLRVFDGSSWNTIAGNAVNVSTVAGISANVTTVAGISANVTTVANDGTDIGTVAGISADVTSVAGVATEIGRLGTTDAVADMNLLGTADVVADMALLGTADCVADMALLGTTDVISDMNTLAVSDVLDDMETCANNNTNITNVGGDITNVNSVAGDLTNVGTCATNIANINTAATNIADVNNFVARYRFGSTDPTTNNDDGDLFYNTSSDTLKVWNGSAWTTAATGTSGFITTASGGTMAANIDFADSHKVTGLAAPTNDNDAARKKYVDDEIAGLDTNLSYTAGTRVLASSTGTNATLPEAVASGNSGLMTGSDKNKLDGIASGAEVNVQSDWNASSGDAAILNKPTLLTSVTNSDVASNAAIAGSKISPDFGTQNVVTTGTVGVGTNSPTTKLHVQQSAVTSAPSRAAALYLENNANCEVQFVGKSDADCQLRFGTSSNSFKGALEYELDNNNLKAYTDGTERMRVDSSGNLQVSVGQFTVGTTATTGLQFINNGTFGTLNSIPLVFRTVSGERMRIDTSGNVGIGKSSHLFYRLTFQEGNGDDNRIGWSSTSGNRKSSIDCANTAAIRFNTGTSDTERMRIDSSGDVGIGFASPLGKLHVRAADECNFVVREESTSLVLSAETNSGRDNNRAMTLEGNGFVFNANGAEKARIDASGRLLVGTTTEVASGSPSSSVHLVDGGGGKIYMMRDDAGSTVAGNDLGMIRFYSNDGGAQESARIEAEADLDHGTNDKPGRLVFATTADGDDSPTERMRIDSSGNVGIGETNPTTALHIKTAANKQMLRLDSPVASPKSLFMVVTDDTSGDCEIRGWRNTASGTHEQTINFDSDGPSFLLGGNFGLRHSTPQFALTLAQDGGQHIGWEDSGNTKRASITCGNTTDDLEFYVGSGATQMRMRLEDRDGIILHNTSTSLSTPLCVYLTAVGGGNDNAGARSTGFLRLHDGGSQNNRYHGIDIRNRNSGDVRIMNKDIGVSNKADMEFWVDNGTDITNSMTLKNNLQWHVDAGYGSVQQAFGVRAWAQCSSNTIRGSAGINSVSRVAAGNYRVTLSFTMPDANYACAVSGSAGNTSGGTVTADSTNFSGNGNNTVSTTVMQFRGVTGSGGTTDNQMWNFIVVR